MPDFEVRSFTEKVATKYQQIITKPGVKYALEDEGIQRAVGEGILRRISSYRDIPIVLHLDNHRRSDGTFDEEALTEAVATGTGQLVLDAIEKEYGTRRGQLWVLHKQWPPQMTESAHIAKRKELQVLGVVWWENLASHYKSHIEWCLATSAHHEKEAIDIDELHKSGL